MKNKLIRLTESDLHNIIKSSVKKFLKEDAANGDFYYQDGHPYGWPDDYMDNDEYVDNHELSKLEDYASGIIDVANMLDCNVDQLRKAKQLIDDFVNKHRKQDNNGNIDPDDLITTWGDHNYDI